MSTAENNERITPSMKNYLSISREYPNFTVLFRIGEFYETFFHDAERVSKCLNMHLTSRGKQSENPIPLCGFPAKSLQQNLTKMLSSGLRIVVTEEETQGDDQEKKRRVAASLITASTFLEEELPDSGPDQWIVLLSQIPNQPQKVGLSCIGITTQEHKFMAISKGDLAHTLESLKPAEVLVLSKGKFLGLTKELIEAEGNKLIPSENENNQNNNPLPLLELQEAKEATQEGTSDEQIDLSPFYFWEATKGDAADTTGTTGTTDTAAATGKDKIADDGESTSIAKLIDKWHPLEFDLHPAMRHLAKQFANKITAAAEGSKQKPRPKLNNETAGATAIICYIKQANPLISIDITIPPKETPEAGNAQAQQEAQGAQEVAAQRATTQNDQNQDQDQSQQPTGCLLNSGAFQVIAPNGFFGQNGLFWYLNETKTQMGKRFLAEAIRQPLTTADQINARLELVQALVQRSPFLEHLRSSLGGIHDISRILVRIESNSRGKDNLANLLESIRWSLFIIETFSDHLELEFFIKHSCHGAILANREHLEDIKELKAFLSDLIMTSPVNEDGLTLIINPRKSPTLWAHKQKYDKAKAEAFELEMKAKRELASTSKLQYKAGLGYVLEIPSKAQIGTDFSVIEIKKTSLLISSKELQRITLETHLAKELIEKEQTELLQKAYGQVLANKKALQALSYFIGELDLITSLSVRSSESGFCRPNIVADAIDFTEAKHPILDRTEKGAIPNDLRLGGKDAKCLIINGANMSGKSTFLRQFIILQIMSQIGCFVPCKNATTTPMENISARIGTGDDIYNQRSTFFNEMLELSEIFQRSNQRSLCIIDEIGRGTSSKEGFAIAAATINVLTSNQKPFILFATHYQNFDQHLTDPSKVAFGHMESHADGDTLVCANKFILGKSRNKTSSALLVAKRAGLPSQLIEAAKAIFETESTNTHTH